MLRPRSFPLYLAALFLSSALFPQTVTAQEDFTIVVMPDTQIYAEDFPHIFTRQADWIGDNRAALNIKFVIHVGDIVNNAEDPAQWTLATAAADELEEAGLPYAWAIGNHDYDNERPSARIATAFNRHFGPNRYSRHSWYGGQYPAGSNENFYTTFSTNGVDYLILVLEMHPRDAARDWGAAVLRDHPNHKVIVVTHSFMYFDDTRVDNCDTNDLAPSSGSYPETLWENFIRKYANIIMVVSGHITSIGTGRRSDLGDHDNLVNQMLANYQDWAEGGEGWLRLLKFRPSLNKIEVKTYSPWKNTFLRDSRNEFTLDYMAKGSGSGTGTASGFVRVPRSAVSPCIPISDVTVSAAGQSTSTDSSGHFSLPLAAPNTYEIEAQKPGWRSVNTTAKVNAGYSTQADFYLTSTGQSPAADFTFAGPTDVRRVNVGQSLTYSLSTAPLNGYTGTVAYSCAETTGVVVACNFSPSTAAMAGGPMQTQLTVTVNSVAQTASLTPKIFFAGLPIGLASILLIGLRVKSRKYLLFLLLAVAFTVSCGAGAENPPPPTAAQPSPTPPTTPPAPAPSEVPASIVVTATGSGGNTGSTPIVHRVHLPITVIR